MLAWSKADREAAMSTFRLSFECSIEQIGKEGSSLYFETWRGSASRPEPTQPRPVEPAGGQAMRKVVINNVEEYEAATQEAQELNGAPEGSLEERRLVDLMLAIEIWDAKHDDATAWRDA